MKRKLSIKKIVRFCLFILTFILFILVIVKLVNVKTEPKEEKVEKVVVPVQTETIIQKVETQYIYDENMPNTADQLILEYALNITKDSNGNVIEEQVPSVVKVGTGASAVYVGNLTAYGGDCNGCSGNVSCKTKSGEKYNLKTSGQIYKDEEYGNVRIIAAPLSLFPCGTIVKVEHESLGVFNAIVLDTGYSVKNAWNNGKVWIDLAFQTQSDPNIKKVNSKNVTYKVQRWSWK